MVHRIVAVLGIIVSGASLWFEEYNPNDQLDSLFLLGLSICLLVHGRPMENLTVRRFGVIFQAVMSGAFFTLVIAEVAMDLWLDAITSWVFCVVCLCYSIKEYGSVESTEGC